MAKSNKEKITSIFTAPSDASAGEHTKLTPFRTIKVAGMGDVLTLLPEQLLNDTVNGVFTQLTVPKGFQYLPYTAPGDLTPLGSFHNDSDNVFQDALHAMLIWPGDDFPEHTNDHQTSFLGSHSCTPARMSNSNLAFKYEVLTDDKPLKAYKFYESGSTVTCVPERVNYFLLSILPNGFLVYLGFRTEAEILSYMKEHQKQAAKSWEIVGEPTWIEGLECFVIAYSPVD